MICLIASAAYVDGELASEFGNIPPAFLPVGNRRLYEHQVEWIERSGVDDIYISLPEGYKLSGIDLQYFQNKNVKVLFPDVGISLGESIEYCLGVANMSGEISILHGDTLFMDIDCEKGNFYSVSKNEGYYSRAVIDAEIPYLKLLVREALDDETIISGFFSFTDADLFRHALCNVEKNFVRAIEEYARHKKVRLINSKCWLDFGHVTSYFRSRANITTQRKFNGLKINKNVVVKSSLNSLKIKAEYEWFQNVPPAVKIYCPKTLWYNKHEKGAEYGIEYIYASSLSDLYVFSAHKVKTWERIFLALKEFLEVSEGFTPSGSIEYSAFNDLYLDKTLLRLGQYSKQTGFDVSVPLLFNGLALPSLTEITYQVSKCIQPVLSQHLAVVHGDLCFSNILYSFRSQSVKVIDPRGIDAHEVVTVYGDRRYDVAKLAHSVIGLYDHIIAGLAVCDHTESQGYIFHVNDDDDSSKVMEELFVRVILNGDLQAYKEVLAINVLLFLSMLPLHDDNRRRQHLLMLNALRLFKKFEEESIS